MFCAQAAIKRVQGDVEENPALAFLDRSIAAEHEKRVFAKTDSIGNGIIIFSFRRSPARVHPEAPGRACPAST